MYSKHGCKRWLSVLYDSIRVNLIEAHFDDLLDYIGVFLDVMKMLHNHGVLVVFVSK